MKKLKVLSRRLLFIFPLFLAWAMPKHDAVDLNLKAKFYDETGTFIGNYGATDDNSPIYIVSGKLVFPRRFQVGMTQMTAKEIVAQVGTEVIYDRQRPINELKLHAGIFKLPPKAHRDEIQKIIEQTHLDTQIPTKLDNVDFEIGGCGYHNNAGDLIHLRAVDGKKDDVYPSVSVFNAVDYASKVDTNQQLIAESGARLIYENRVEYTWHTHPPKLNPRSFEQTPSIHDFRFGKSYQHIKQHFLISLKFKSVYYFGFATELPMQQNAGEQGGFNIKMSYEQFFALK